MPEDKLEANYVTCAVCKMTVPQSCVIIDKGTVFPELMRDEHLKHELEICYKCYYKAYAKGKEKAMAA